MDIGPLLEAVQELADHALEMVNKATQVQEQAQQVAMAAAECSGNGLSPFMIGFTVFVLAIYVGYYVVWRVTPALHSPLMAVTNAISSVIIVGALVAAGMPSIGMPKIFGFLAVTLASINIFGGFMVTSRMLQMFSGKK